MPSDAEIDRHLANLREQFGAGLTDDQVAVVRERLVAALQAGEAMRAVPLDNADEPFIIFSPYSPPLSPSGEDAQRAERAQ